jgi:hypothetical protein
MFTEESREKARNYILDLANSDKRIVAAGVIGSYAADKQDRWSDIDLTFGVDDSYSINELLEEWTSRITTDLNAVRLFDIQRSKTVYRVFLLDDCLQVDISFTPVSAFASNGQNFKLLFGSFIDNNSVNKPSIYDLAGYAVHHALRARVCIERKRFWNAEYWLSAARDHALTIAALKAEADTSYGKGYDDLPSEVLERFNASFVTTLQRDELFRCLEEVTNGLIFILKDDEELLNSLGKKLLLIQKQ